LDTVLDVIDSSFDQAQRFTAASTAQRMLLEDAALVPMFSEQFNVVTRKEVQGFKFTALGIPTFRDVWLNK
jgi:MarR-like DNA-binding transcriptional regulator SgrR of sgrS sRNA